MKNVTLRARTFFPVSAFPPRFFAFPSSSLSFPPESTTQANQGDETTGRKEEAKSSLPLYLWRSQKFNGTVTCLIYEKFPATNLPSVKTRWNLDRAVGISPRGLFSKVNRSTAISHLPLALEDPFLAWTDRFEVVPFLDEHGAQTWVNSFFKYIYIFVRGECNLFARDRELLWTRFFRKGKFVINAKMNRKSCTLFED